MTRLRSLVVLILLLATVGVAVARDAAPVSAIYCAPWDDVCRQLKDQQGEAASTKAKLDGIEHRIRDTQQKMHALADLISVLDAQIAAEQADIDATQGRINVLSGQIKATEADLARRQTHIRQREDLLGQRVREMDKHATIDYLALALTASTFNELVDRIVTMQEIIRSDHQLVTDLRAERDQVRIVMQTLQQKRSEQAGLLATQQSEKARLQGDRADEQSAFSYQKQLEAQFDAQRRELERQQAMIMVRIQQLQAAYAAEARAAGGGNGQFIWPEGGSPAITQGFGCTDLLGEPWWPSCATRHFHTGIDIAGEWGTPVYAADSGVASVFWGWGGGYGNFVIITHGNGYASVYGHLSRIVVGDGQLVYRGQTIGNEGSTGYSTGPHLHFEIRYWGNYQNPCTYLGC